MTIEEISYNPLHIVLDSLFPSANGIAKNREAYNDYKAKTFQNYTAVLSDVEIAPYDVPVGLLFIHHCKKIRDIDNFSVKFFIDTVLKYRFIKDDSHVYVPVITHIAFAAKSKEFSECYVAPLKEFVALRKTTEYNIIGLEKINEAKC